jgi:plastocyanin
MWRFISNFLIACVAVSALIAGCLYGCSQRQSDATTMPTTAPVAPMMAATHSAEQQVTIDNFAFDPQVLTISPGTKVTWLNRDDVPHTATSSDSPRKFKSPALDTDEKFSHVFSEPGTYPYFCAVHPKMTGKIVVK